MSRRGVDFILELEGITEDDLTEPICTEMQEYFNRLDFSIKQVGVLENNNLCIQGQIVHLTKKDVDAKYRTFKADLKLILSKYKLKYKLTDNMLLYFDKLY